MPARGYYDRIKVVKINKKGDKLMAEEVKFCPLLTIIRAGQANYMVCQTNCAFFLDDECAFITAAKVLKDIKDLNLKDKKDNS